MKTSILTALAASSIVLAAEAIESADALQEVRDAADQGDASGITVEDLNAIDGVDGAVADFIEDYHDIIESEIDPADSDADLTAALQEFITAIGSTPPDAGEQKQGTNMAELWPDSRYTVNDNGTVSDSITGLMWQQCSAGQTLVGGAELCQDPEDENDLLLNWKSALEYARDTNAGSGYAGFNDWRVPNVRELGSLVARNRFSPAVNATAMPAILKDWYWSSSPDFGDGQRTWQVSLFDGQEATELRSEGAHVVLVRTPSAQVD